MELPHLSYRYRGLITQNSDFLFRLNKSRCLSIWMICVKFSVLGIFRLTYYILFSAHSRFGVTVQHAKGFALTLSQYIIADSRLARNLIASRLKTLQVFRTSANVRGWLAQTRTQFALSKAKLEVQVRESKVQVFKVWYFSNKTQLGCY